ncbi:chromosome segregation protein SMC [Microbacterium marinilacus]|uniref:Chromosome partition protein Smc n=1 Tax=Microbacterium marinilacus TaxID=415209 RepID=A0ABP7B364_9MICO|nr:chromosome segregation protein SMC [Microbacterium marinilacus]MBY0687923.1 chromosome segregation protein SMC [Microbacterium marinilacus]
MHLKSVTLKGFKSFAQPTTFALEPGVTAIVGPNGSGKSNVVDALAWVMGEQGAKTLRGGKMEDVIFAGTSTRGPLGRAEVQLTIDNADGALPIEYSEVTISRTLFRNGSSEYAINGESCRLLDVQELLSDSGLGREMHVIVGQGRLDAVLQATPEDRRGFIEEAAGILKHRRRKEKTLRKLEAMEQNLTRLSDLAGEIRRQLKPLGKQAEIAREAQTIAAIVRDAKARLLADEVVQLRAALADHARSEHERHTERLVLQEQVDGVRARIAQLEREQNAEAVDEARRVAFALEQVQERLRGLYTLANQRLALLGADDDPDAVAITVTQAAIDEARAEITEISDGLGAAQDAVQEAARALVRARGELDALDADIAEQSALVSEHDMRLTALGGSAEAAQSALAAVRGGVLRQQNALDAANQRRIEASEELEQIDPATTVEGSAAEHQAAYEAAQRETNEAESELERIREAHRAAEREADALTAKVAALSSALDVQNGAAALIARGGEGVRGLVGDEVHVEAGYEAAIAAVLGPLAEGVLVETRAAAYAVAQAAPEFGVVDIVIADSHGASPSTPVVPGVVAASDVVRAPEGVLRILGHVAVADDLEAARAAFDAAEAGASERLTIVTRSGEVCTAQTLRAGTGERSRLELQAERDTAASRLDEVRVQVDDLSIQRAEATERLQTSRRLAKEALQELREHDAQLAQHAERLNKATVRHEAAVAECDRLEAGLAQAQGAVADAEAKARAASDELNSALEAPRPMLDASARDGYLAALEEAREEEMRSRLEVETLRERVRAAEARAASLERQREREREAAAAAARRAVIRRAQREVAEGVAAELPHLLDSVDRSVTEARVALAEAEGARATVTSELRELRGQEAGLRERLAGLTESVHGLELQIHEKKLHVSSLLERVSSELGLGEQILVSEYGPDQPVPRDTADIRPVADLVEGVERDEHADEGMPATIPFDRRMQERRLRDAERKLGQLGRVNPLALEEFAALEQRHKFLTEQLDDLVATRKDLMTIIADLDERMQTIFEAAFEDTRVAFTEVFPILFPGGTGSIALTNPNDLLTTGIEVSVRPVGKKIERLSLLSGGERSLAAVAFLTAIFKARPSPFYILDEVEAALDDANLGRLLGVFEQLRESSQLIVITHQKRTMEIADALYGVSMRQDGVSAVVGQRISERAAS